MDLAELLAPITIEELVRDYWQRRPLYILEFGVNNAPAPFRPLASDVW